MTTSLYMPDVVVELAFGSGVRTAAASRTWTFVSAYVELEQGIDIEGGRGDQFSTCDANSIKLVLDNSDGRFTAGLSSSPYYPNVKVGTPIRVRAKRVGGAGYVTLGMGYVDEWPVIWDGSDAYALAPITASSRLAVLGRERKLRSIVEEEILVDSPTAYYPLAEPEGATAAADSSGNSAATLTQAGVGAAVTFGTATGPSTDGLTAATFAGGKFLAGPREHVFTDHLTDYLPWLGCFMNASATGTDSVLWRLTTDSGYSIVAKVTSAGKLSVTHTNDMTGLDEWTFTSSATVEDGTTHHVLLRFVDNGGPEPRLYIDGALDSQVNVMTTFGVTDALWDLSVGGASGFTSFTGTIAHVALGIPATALGATRPAAHADAGLDGFEGETPSLRVARYASYAGVPAVEVDADAGTSPMAHIDTTGNSVLDMLRKVETAEGGVLHDGRDGTLEFRARNSRYLATSAFTLSFATQQIEADYQPVVDRSQIQNDVTAKLPGETVTARVVDQPSVDAYGAAGEELELHTTDAAEPHAAASWRVNTYAEPRPRVPALTVDLLPLPGALQDSLLAADVGTRFATTGAPSQSAASAGDYFVEGYGYTIGPESFVIRLNVSDTSAYVDTFVLDSATRGVLDTNRLAY